MREAVVKEQQWKKEEGRLHKKVIHIQRELSDARARLALQEAPPTGILSATASADHSPSHLHAGARSYRRGLQYDATTTGEGPPECKGRRRDKKRSRSQSREFGAMLRLLRGHLAVTWSKVENVVS